MSEPLLVHRLEFDTVRHSRAVFVTKDTHPQEITTALNLDPLPKGIIVISGGAQEFPPEIVTQTISLIEEAIAPLVYKSDVLIVDGGTDAGVMKITGEVLRRAKYRYPRIIGGEKDDPLGQAPSFRDPLLVGVVPEPEVIYPGVERSSQSYARLDPNHVYFILVCDTQEWGEEVECMFTFLDYLTAQNHIPMVNIVANGGRITIKEAYHAVEQGRHVVVLEGSHRAAKVIGAALDGASEKELINLLWRLGIAGRKHEMEETVHWLRRITRHDKIARFDFLSRPPRELRDILLSRLGLV